MGFTRRALKNYVGPDDKLSGPTATLLNPEKYPLAKYEAPQYPPLARMARIQGKVTVEVTVDGTTGSVAHAHATSGHPLLQKAAEQAASEWKFQPSDTNFIQPIYVVLEFSLVCSDVPGK